MKFHVIMASYNRCNTTLRAIESLKTAAGLAKVDLAVTLYDDASTDNTRTLVSMQFPEVAIIPGTGSAFWAHSMYQAEQRILNRTSSSVLADNEYVVWFNDDVDLDPDAFVRLAGVVSTHHTSVIVCGMRDPISRQTTYSGFHRLGRHPLRLGLVEPGPTVRPVDTFNGNLVLVPMNIAISLESIDGEYAHAFADIDYGYRAKAAGVSVLLAPGTYGTCPRNPGRKWSGVREEWRSFTGVKGGGHPGSIRKILRVGAPRTYPFYFCAIYLLWWLRSMRKLIIRR